MTQVASYDFYDHPEPPRSVAALTWREAIAAIGQRMLDEGSGLERGRIEQARDIALDGAVFYTPGQVAYVQDGTERYDIQNDYCKCADYPQAPQHACRHRLALRVVKQAHQLMEAQMQQLADAATPHAPDCPEAKVSVTLSIPVQGSSLLTTLRSMAHDDASALMDKALALHERYADSATAAPPPKPQRQQGANGQRRQPQQPVYEEEDDIPFDMENLPPEAYEEDEEAFYEPPPRQQRRGKPQPAPAGAPTCKYHHKPMKLSKINEGEFYCTAKENGEYCDYKLKKRG